MGSFYLFGVPIWEDAEAKLAREEVQLRKKEVEEASDVAKNANKYGFKAHKEDVNQAQTEVRHADGSGVFEGVVAAISPFRNAANAVSSLAAGGLNVSTPWGSLSTGGQPAAEPVPTEAPTWMLPAALVGLGAVVILATADNGGGRR